MRLNVSNWKPFCLRKIVDSITKGFSYNDNDLPSVSVGDTDDYYAYVTRSDNNNGIKKFIPVDNYEGLEDAGAITIGDTTATIFYQKIPFVVGQHMAILRAKWLNEYTANFLISVLNLEKEKYPVFGRAYTKDLIEKTIVRLPADANGNPDYLFMENYIRSRKTDITSIPDYFLNEGYDKACWYMDNIDAGKFEQKYAGIHTKANLKLSDRKWERFQIKDLFKTYTGGDLILSNITSGNIPIISHSSENNGVNSYTMEIENRPLFDHTKSISLADRGTFFAARQKEDFYIGTRVKAMVFWDEIFNNNVITPFAIDFIVTVINHERFRFSYGRNCTSGLDSLKIKLPVDANGNPDYLFMDAYIKSRPFSVNI